MYVVTPTIPRFIKLIKTILNNSYNNKGYGFRNTTLNWLYSIIEIFYKDLIPPTHKNEHPQTNTYIHIQPSTHTHPCKHNHSTTYQHSCAYSHYVHCSFHFFIPRKYTNCHSNIHRNTHIYMSDWINVSVWCMSMSINYCINILM